MSIKISIVVTTENGRSDTAEFSADPFTTMDEMVALASSMVPAPDPPFVVKCGNAVLYDTADPSTGSFTLSTLGITNSVVLDLLPTSAIHQPPQKRSSPSPPPTLLSTPAPPTTTVAAPPLPPTRPREITAEDILRATASVSQQQSPPPPPPPSQTRSGGSGGGGITAEDVLRAVTAVSSNSGKTQPNVFQQRHRPTAEEFIALAKRDPRLMNRLLNKCRGLADAVLNDKREVVQRYLDEINKAEDLQRRARENPMDVEVQREIEEQIHERNIRKSFMQTYEDNPELLLGVTLLYVPCKVNGVDVVGMVDTGAQVSVMSSEVARKCGLSWLIDTKVNSVMRGVGEAKAVGRIYGTSIQFGPLALQCSITIVDTNVDFIIGCDQLRRHKCVVDLDKNVLRIGTVEIPFLGEKDIPERDKNTNLGSNDDDKE